MDTVSYTHLIAVYYNPFVKKRGFRNIVLLLASLFFYGWGEPVFVFLMILSIIVNWAFGLMVDGMAKKGNKLGMKLGMIPVSYTHLCYRGDRAGYRDETF